VSRIRIESTEDVVTDARVFYVAEDGTETEISRAVSGVDVHLYRGELARASLHVMCAEVEARAELNDAVMKLVTPYARFRFLRRIRRRVVHGLKTILARSLGQHLRVELVRHERRARRFGA
jgi:hypothetical protein